MLEHKQPIIRWALLWLGGTFTIYTFPAWRDSPDSVSGRSGSLSVPVRTNIYRLLQKSSRHRRKWRLERFPPGFVLAPLPRSQSALHMEPIWNARAQEPLERQSQPTKDTSATTKLQRFWLLQPRVSVSPEIHPGSSSNSKCGIYLAMQKMAWTYQFGFFNLIFSSVLWSRQEGGQQLISVAQILGQPQQTVVHACYYSSIHVISKLDGGSLLETVTSAGRTSTDHSSARRRPTVTFNVP